MAGITGQFDWQTSEVVPAYVKGKDAKAIFEATEGIRTGTMGYDEATQTFYGSTPFVAGRIDTQVRPLGLRVATLRDLSRPEVMRLIKNNHYSDTPALVLRSTDDTHSKNSTLIKQIAEEAEKRNVKLPVMVTGFDVAKSPEDKNGYGIILVPRDDFAVVNDERLDSKYHGKSFSDVDELGLPNFDENGSRTWYARNKGLSRLYLNRVLDLYSDGGSLANSSDSGRVVLVRAEGTAK